MVFRLLFLYKKMLIEKKNLQKCVENCTFQLVNHFFNNHGAINLFIAVNYPSLMYVGSRLPAPCVLRLLPRPHA